MVRSRLIMALLFTCSAFTACAPTAQVVKPGGPTISEAQAEPATGGKMRVAVMSFENQTKYDVGRGMRAMLTSALFRTNKFIVVEREMLPDVLSEQELAHRGTIRQDTATPEGEVEGAQLLIYGKVTDFRPGQRGGGAIVGRAQQSLVAVDIRIVDARTARVVSATTVEGRATDAALGTGILKYVENTSPLYSLGVWNNTPVGSAIRICIDKAVDYIINVEMGRSSGEVVAVPEVIEMPSELKNLKMAKQENTAAIAVVIGNRDYKNRDVPPVNYAIRDAGLMKEALIKSLGYREGNIIYETNATKGTLESIFGTAGNPRGRLADLVAPGKSDVFVYYSGHGAPNLESRRGYLLPSDGDPNVIDISGYPLEVLYRNLASLKARSITIVTDACFSGAPLFRKASPVGIVVENPLIAMKNAYIINSSSGTELSSWYPEKGLGLFTYYFLLGLTGPADKNGDGKITLGELHAYIEDQVPYMSRKLHSGRKQTPTFIVKDESKILVTYR